MQIRSQGNLDDGFGEAVPTWRWQSQKKPWDPHVSKCSVKSKKEIQRHPRHQSLSPLLNLPHLSPSCGWRRVARPHHRGRGWWLLITCVSLLGAALAKQAAAREDNTGVTIVGDNNAAGPHNGHHGSGAHCLLACVGVGLLNATDLAFRTSEAGRQRGDLRSWRQWYGGVPRWSLRLWSPSSTRLCRPPRCHRPRHPPWWTTSP